MFVCVSVQDILIHMPYFLHQLQFSFYFFPSPSPIVSCLCLIINTLALYHHHPTGAAEEDQRRHFPGGCGRRRQGARRPQAGAAAWPGDGRHFRILACVCVSLHMCTYTRTLTHARARTYAHTSFKRSQCLYRCGDMIIIHTYKRTHFTHAHMFVSKYWLTLRHLV